MVERWQERLRELRRERGLTAQQLGDMAGVHWQTIYRIETEEGYQPRRTTMEKLAGALDMRLGEFVSRLTGTIVEGIVAEMADAERRIKVAGAIAQHEEIDRIVAEARAEYPWLADILESLHGGVTLDGYVTLQERTEMKEVPDTYWPKAARPKQQETEG